MMMAALRRMANIAGYELPLVCIQLVCIVFSVMTMAGHAEHGCCIGRMFLRTTVCVCVCV
jgi:hypothetical protein